MSTASKYPSKSFELKLITWGADKSLLFEVFKYVIKVFLIDLFNFLEFNGIFRLQHSLTVL